MASLQLPHRNHNIDLIRTIFQSKTGLGLSIIIITTTTTTTQKGISPLQ